MKKNDLYSKYVSTHYQFIAPATLALFRKRYYVWKSYFSSLLPKNKSCKILEIGAGVGHNLYALKELGYKHCLGTDYSPECVSVCKKHGFEALVVTSATEKKFYASHKGKFDLIVLYDVVEHYVPDSGAELLASVRQMLTPSGSVVICLPNANHPFSNTLFFADITHKFIYNETSLSQLLRNSGFSEIAFKQINSFVLDDDVMVRQLVKRLVLAPLAYIGELFWRLMALSQGIVLSECKPTLIAVART